MTARAVFERLLERFTATAGASECETFTRSFAGHEIAVRTVGADAAEWLGSALGTRESGGDAAHELLVEVAPGAPPRSGEACVISDERYVVLESPAFVAGLDRDAGRLVALVRDFEALPQWERAKPLSTLLGVWCEDRGVRVVHAGLVSVDGYGVLFAGRSGVGKSTAAVACLRAGFDFLGDDVVGMRAQANGRFEGLHLFSSAALERTHLERAVLAGQAARGPADDRNKVIVSPAAVGRGRIVARTTIAAVLIPKLTDGVTCVPRPATAREALLSLAPSSVVRRATSGRRLLHELSRLVSSVPCFWLETSRKPSEIPDVVARILSA